MAAESICTVDPGLAGDYPSHNAAEADNYGAGGANLQTLDKWVNCKLRSTDGSNDTTGVTIAGMTTDATRCIVVQTSLTDTGGDGPAGSYRHSGVRPAAGAKVYVHAMALASSGAAIINNQTQNVAIRGLTIELTANANSCVGIVSSVAAFDVDDNLVIEIGATPGTLGPYGIWINGAGAGIARVWGNLVYDFKTSTSAIGIYILPSAFSTIYTFANTVCDCYYGIFRGSATGTAIVVDNLSFGSTDCFYGTWSTGSANNSYSEGVDPGTAGISLVGVGGAAVFANYTGDDFHLLSTAAVVDKGKDLRTDPNCPITTDIDTAARLTGTAQDIGADELAPVVIIIPEEQGPGPRPGQIYRGRVKRRRQMDIDKTQERAKRDISKAFVGMYRRLERGDQS